MIERVLQLLATTAPELGRWLSLGLALLTVAMLQLWRGARSGNGWLTLCALSRTLPLDEDERARSSIPSDSMRSSDLCWRPHWTVISTERKPFSQKQVGRPLARGRISTSISTRRFRRRAAFSSLSP